MPFKELFVWVEGPDDQRFVDTILRVEFEKHYDLVQVIPYAGMKTLKIIKFIESIRAIPSADYIFVADHDAATCVSTRKQELTARIKSLQTDRIAIAVREIEGWYLAGLTTTGHVQLGITEMPDTDHLDKENFDFLRSKGFSSRIDWMVEMLRHYSLARAVTRNGSLRYFVSKFLATEPKSEKQAGT